VPVEIVERKQYLSFHIKKKSNRTALIQLMSAGPKRQSKKLFLANKLRSKNTLKWQPN